MKILSWIESKEKLLQAMPVRKKILVLVVATLICSLLAGGIGAYLGNNPVILSIRYEDNTVYRSPELKECVYFFYEDEFARYYLPAGMDPFDFTVTYLLGGSESLFEAFENDCITIEDLDRFDIEYGIVSKDN